MDTERTVPRAARRLGRLLAGALPEALRRQLATVSQDEYLVVVPSPALAGLPWEWLTVRRAPLFVSRPVMRQPWEVTSPARGRPFVHVPPRLLLVGDSVGTERWLPADAREMRTLRDMAAKVVPKANITLLTGHTASYAGVLAGIESGEYDLVHFSGRIGMTAGEPSLRLADGFVRGTDLVTLLSSRPPAVFVVNGGGAIRLPLRDASRQYARKQPTSEVLEAESADTLGWASVAARAGVGVFIGGFGPLTNEYSSDFGIALYERLFAGDPAADAMWAARQSTYEQNPDAYCFVMSGYPDLVLCRDGGASRQRRRRGR